ncbi:MAG: hypothetical protein GXC72_13120, partial [Chitinophagaceae bacterium]|nr:hypothetical protein [Chitinophagaceae bacterium]
MVQAYNFLASWQLFPEKCDYQFGLVPKSGSYRIESIRNGHALAISSNWVSLENEAFYTQYELLPNGELQPFDNQELADTVEANFDNASALRIRFYKTETLILDVLHEIMPNG